MTDSGMHAPEPYADQWSLLDDFMLVLNLRLYCLYKYHSWVGLENNLQNMMGLAVSRTEFEMNLARASDAIARIHLSGEEHADLEILDSVFRARMAATATAQGTEELPVLRLVRRLLLDGFETDCLLLAFAVQMERRYEKIFAYLQDDITRRWPQAEIAIRLFARSGERIADYIRYFAPSGVLSRYILTGGNGTDQPFSMPLVLRQRLIDELTGNAAEIPQGFMDLSKPADPLDPLIGADFPMKCIDALLPEAADRRLAASEHMLLFLVGGKGSGRKHLIRHAARRRDRSCLFVDVREFLDMPGSIEEKLGEVVLETLLRGSLLCFSEFDALLEETRLRDLHLFVQALSQTAAALPETVFMTSARAWKDTHLPKAIVKADITLEAPDEEERLIFWESFLAGVLLEPDLLLAELASKFKFTPGQIRHAVHEAVGLIGARGIRALDAHTMHRSCYAQVVMRLDALASLVRPAHDWGDLVLPDDQVALLREACDHVRHRHIVYRQWGFDRKISYGKGLSLLFSGPPGTGKTMAAQVIANQLHMEMYKIQLSQVVSKYIGETEKNLKLVFEEARSANCILFFDETDALFGKRSEVKDAHDRHANIETAFLLQQMEEYDGVVIMATNLLQNIDSAFMRRISFVIGFPFPDAPTRRLLWEKMLEGGAPVAPDIDFAFLSGQFRLAGGNIKNIVLHAAFQAAAANSPITMKHLLASTVNEQRKNSILVAREDLREYADLVF